MSHHQNFSQNGNSELAVAFVLKSFLRRALLRGNAVSVGKCLSAFFCVRTLRQVSLHILGSEMNWTLSFIGESDKLVIGRHLLLSPVSTAVKPACSVFAHRPNPTQERDVDVILGLWKNIGLTKKEVSSSVTSLGS